MVTLSVHCRTCKKTTEHSGEIKMGPAARAPRLTGKCCSCSSPCSRFISREVATGAGFNAVAALNRAIPGEKHMRLPSRKFKKASFIGPGTRLDLRLDKNDKPVRGSEPLNKLDEEAMAHDISYRDGASMDDIKRADEELVRGAREIINSSPSFLERGEARAVEKIISSKLRFGVGVSGGELATARDLREDVCQAITCYSAKPAFGGALSTIPSPADLFKKLANASVKDVLKVKSVLDRAFAAVGRNDIDVGSLARKFGEKLLRHALSPVQNGARKGIRGVTPGVPARRTVLSKAIDSLLEK